MADGKGKPPASQFYWGDWLRNERLRGCCLAARGLWVDLMAFMNNAEPRGYLKPEPKAIARRVGEHPRIVAKLMDELRVADVPGITEDGRWFSRRMVKEERHRQLRAAGGILSLNHPNVPRPKDGEKDTEKGAKKDHVEDAKKDTSEGYPSPPSPSARKMKIAEEEGKNGGGVEEPTGEYDPDGTRAAAFLERYPAIYARAREGAHYRAKPNRDWLYALDLVRGWPNDERLDAMAEVFLRMDDPKVLNRPGTIGQFLNMAPECDRLLRKHGR
jgi:hypothetical protein